MTNYEGLGMDPNMPSPFKRILVLKVEDVEIVAGWKLVPKLHPLEMCPSI
jgi:hypothetical protein